MLLTLIAAVAENGVVGKDGALPWHISADLKYFKSVTMAKPMIMGRTTFESFPKPLPGRAHIILTRSPGYGEKLKSFPNCYAVNSPKDALDLAEKLCQQSENNEAVVIGGAEVYQLFLPRTKKMYLTEVHAVVEGDTFFPAYDNNKWREVSREMAATDEKSGLAYSFVIYEKN